MNFSLKKNLKKTVCIHDDKFISNGRFFIEKSILNKSQLKVVESYKKNEHTINEIKRMFYNDIKSKKCIKQFKPELIKFQKDLNTVICINNNIVYSLYEGYYNFIKSNKCKIIIVDENNKNLFAIYNKNNKFVGFVVPTSILDNNISENTKNYNDYTNEIQEIKNKKRLENENSIRVNCVYFDGIKKKALKFKQEIHNIKFYIEPRKVNNNDYAYIKINDYYYPICEIRYIKGCAEKIIKENINVYDLLEKDFKNRIKNNGMASLGVTELLGYNKEEIIKHNKNVSDELEKENKEKNKKKSKKILSI